MSAIRAAKEVLELLAYATEAERDVICRNLRSSASIIDQLSQCRAMLVYQAGIANVFHVASLNLADYGRHASRMIQADYRTCEAFARGLAAAGWVVKTAACNAAGDISTAHWSEDLEAAPFAASFHPVDSAAA